MSEFESRRFIEIVEKADKSRELNMLLRSIADAEIYSRECRFEDVVDSIIGMGIAVQELVYGVIDLYKKGEVSDDDRHRFIITVENMIRGCTSRVRDNLESRCSCKLYPRG